MNHSLICGWLLVVIILSACKKDSSNNTSGSPRSIDTIIITVAGNGTWGFSGDNSSALNAQLSQSAKYVCGDNMGNIYISDAGNNRIRKVDLTGTITTIAGNGVAGFSGDGGLAINAQIKQPRGITIDGEGNIYFADQGNKRIRRINSSGIINTFAGKGNLYVVNYGDDSIATKAILDLPEKIAFDQSGNMYIADAGQNRIRKISKSTNIITTVAGKGNVSSLGDGGLAINAYIKMPTSIKFDRDGNMLIVSETRIRKVNPAGIISTIAGDGSFGCTGDGGPAVAAKVTANDIDIDQSGNIYLADYGHSRIRKINRSGIITTFAGSGRFQDSGDGGPPAEASFYYPSGIFINQDGTFLIADYGAHKIRKILFR